MSALGHLNEIPEAIFSSFIVSFSFSFFLSYEIEIVKKEDKEELDATMGKTKRREETFELEGVTQEMEDEGVVVNVEPPPLTLYTSLQKAMKDVMDDTGERQYKNHITLAQLYRFADGYDIALMIFSFVMSMASGVVYPIFTLFSGDMIDTFDMSKMPTEGSFAASEYGSMLDQILQGVQKSINKTALQMVILSIVSCVSLFGMTVGASLTASRQGDRMRKHFLEASLSQEVGWFDSHQTGALTALLTDVQRIQIGMGTSAMYLVNSVVGVIASFIIAYIKGWRLALVITAVAPVSILILTPIIMGMSKYTKQVTGLMSKAGQIAEEAISCSRTVTSFTTQIIPLRKYNKLLITAHKVGNIKGLLTGLVGGVFNIIMFGCFALSLWYGNKLVIDGSMTPGAVFVTFVSLFMGVMTIGYSAPMVNEVTTATGIAHDLFAVIDRHSAIDPRRDETDPGIDTHFEITGNIEFRGVCFRYPTRPEALVLRNFDLVIPAGKKCALVGQSGSGKSTVAGLLERFYDCEDGFGEVLIDGRNIKDIGIKCLREQVGIVAQEPSLFATTIRENIAWGQVPSKGPVSDDEIIAAAKLANAHNFISALPHGYDTLVGERGTQLSGGQKQRIAIARALIKKPKIMIFDEATSALDTKSERDVQEAIDRVSGEYTSVIIAHRLSTIRNADMIVAIEKGSIMEIGTHAELMAIEGGVYRTLVERQQLRSAEGTQSTSVSPSMRTPSPTHRAESPASDSPCTSPDPTGTSTTTTTTTTTTTHKKKSKKQSKKGNTDSGHDLAKELAEKAKAEDIEKAKKIGMRLLFRSFKFLKPSAFLVVVSCICAIANGAMMPCSSLFIVDMTNVMMFNPEGASSSALDAHNDDVMDFVYLFIGVAFGFCIVKIMQSAVMNVAAERMSHYLRFECFKAILRQDAGWFDSPKNSVGMLSTRLASDTTMLYQLTGNQLMAILQGISSFVVGVLIGFTGYWKIALVMLACVPVIVFISYVETVAMTDYSVKMKKVYEEAGSVASEGLESVRTVISIEREGTFIDRFMAHLDKPRKYTYKNSIIHGAAYALDSMFTFLMTALAFWYGTDCLLKGEPVTFVGIMRAQMGISMGASSFGQIMTAMPNYGKGLAAAMHIFDLLEREPVVPYPRVCNTTPIHRDHLENLPEDAPESPTAANMKRKAKKGEEQQPSVVFGTKTLDTVRGEITFEDVHFAYPVRPDIQVLKGLTFTAKPKQMVALVGESGCGKSTVVSLLERLYRPSSGSVKVDGVPIDELEIGWLRAQMGLVGQEPVLFAASIYENIRYGRLDATREEIEHAAMEANAHKFITGFPEGYDTQVGEKGVTLSGGQKQRIAIARALVRNPKILLLDEATSALDTQSEKLVQDALDRAQQGRTTIVIAHRLSTVQNADKIVVIDNGVVVETGTHAELISRPDSHYAYLAATQVAGP